MEAKTRIEGEFKDDSNHDLVEILKEIEEDNTMKLLSSRAKIIPFDHIDEDYLLL